MQNPFNALDHRDTLLRVPYGCKPLAPINVLAPPAEQLARIAAEAEFNQCLGQFERQWDSLKPVVEAPSYTKPLSFAYGVPSISDIPFTNIKADCKDDCIKENTKYVFLFKSKVTFHTPGTFNFKTKSGAEQKSPCV